MNVAVVRKTHQIARPLKVLVPLIQEELVAASDAGLEHYRFAGAMLNEAREQVSHGSWSRWLTKNFDLSTRTASRYMQLASKSAAGDRFAGITTLHAAIGEKHTHTPRMEGVRINVKRLADERQKRDDEIKLHREMALQLIDLGYRAMATRLHPDRGGSRDAMSRLNTVRDELKSVAATRRFV